MGRFRGRKGGPQKYGNKFVRVLPDDAIIPHVTGETRGKFFRSKKEATRFVYLRHLERAGEVMLLECQVPFDLVGFGVMGQPVFFGRYVADFCYFRGGRPVVEDVKGMRTVEYELKKKLMLFLRGIEILET
jgi:hypothetical protein